LNLFGSAWSVQYESSVEIKAYDFKRLTSAEYNARARHHRPWEKQLGVHLPRLEEDQEERSVQKQFDYKNEDVQSPTGEIALF